LGIVSVDFSQQPLSRSATQPARPDLPVSHSASLAEWLRGYGLWAGVFLATNEKDTRMHAADQLTQEFINRGLLSCVMVSFSNHNWSDDPGLIYIF